MLCGLCGSTWADCLRVAGCTTTLRLQLVTLHRISIHVYPSLLCRRLEELLSGAECAEQAPAPAALLQQVRSLVDGCYGSMLRYGSRRARQQAVAAGAGAGQIIDAAAAPDVAAAAGDEATSMHAPAAAAAAAAGGQHAPGQEALSLDGMRALMLQQVPAAVADLRRQHVVAAEPEERRRLAHRLLMELLLRLCICGYGELAPAATASGAASISLCHLVPAFWRLVLCMRLPWHFQLSCLLPPCLVWLTSIHPPAGARPGSQLPAGLYPDIEALMQVQQAVHAVYANNRTLVQAGQYLGQAAGQGRAGQLPSPLPPPPSLIHPAHLTIFFLLLLACLPARLRACLPAVRGGHPAAHPCRGARRVQGHHHARLW